MVGIDGREVHFDGEATVTSGLCSYGGVVGIRDGSDDGETEAVTVGMTGAGGVEALQRFEESWQLRRRDRRPVVGDRQDRVTVRGSRAVGIDGPSLVTDRIA